ncbi:MAG: LysR substrate-binding domain-containing protein [Gammaproteobacteria bacterium]|nr:LysR substrate-binding domain-containing protein [Gammaproteobacteria bacterium]
MKLQQLRFLDAVVRNNLNVSSAAEELYTSQPGVSHQIKLLEEELDIKIFERSGKKLTGISPAGYAVLEHVNALLNNVKSIKQAAREYSNAHRGSLSIATTHTQAQFILPPILSNFSNQYPRIDLQVHQGNPKAMCKLAANNSVDFVIASETIDEFDELITIPAYRWNRYIVVPKGHSLEKKSEITLVDLASFPILTYMLGLTGRSKLDRTFHAANLEPNVVFTATDSDVIKTYVKLGFGVGIIAEMAKGCPGDDALSCISASHLFPDSLIKIGFRHSRHISAYQYEFLHMMAPHLDLETIKELAHTKALNDREKILQQYPVPTYHSIREEREAKNPDH